MNNEFIVKLPTMNDIALFVAKCGKFEEDIFYIVGRYTVDAKSIMGVMSTSFEKPATVRIETENKRVIDTFMDEIALWTIGEY